MPPKRPQLAAAATSMDLVLGDGNLLTEILLRLPAKFLIKYKSVSKKWLSLISSAYFCHRYTLRRPKLQQSLIIQMPTMQCFYFNQTINGGGNVMIPYSLSVPNHEILQDCNGLLLLAIASNHARHYVYNPTTGKLELNRINSYYVCNPTTRESRKINLTNNDKFPYVEDITLAFDPSESPYYKVVCVRSTSYEHRSSFAYGIEVYDSESHTWKLSLEPSTFPRINNNGVYWNNSIFWSSNGGGDGFCCFDIAKNEIGKLSFPYADFEGHLRASNGHLYCFECFKQLRILSTVVLWELGGDDHSEWLSKHSREIFHSVTQKRIIPVGFIGGWTGDSTSCTLLTYNDDPPSMDAYNFLEESCESLVCFRDEPDDELELEFGAVMKVFQFGESLALV